MALERALVRTRLIDDAEKSHFRSQLSDIFLSNDDATDSNVDAIVRGDGVAGELGGIVTVEVRSNLSSGIGVRRVDKKIRQVPLKGLLSPSKPEIRFCHVINQALPDGIRVTAWAPLPRNLARPPASSSRYSIFLPKSIMKERTFMTLRENILSEAQMQGFPVDVEVIDLPEFGKVEEGSRHFSDIVEVRFKQRGSDNQGLRKIRSLMDRIFESDESPFLPITSARCKRCCVYELAHSKTLDHLNWNYDAEAMADATLHFQRLQAELAIKAAISRQALDRVEKLIDPDGDLHCDDTYPKSNKLLSRPYHYPLNDILTHLPNDYLLKKYDSYVDFVERNKKVWEQWKKRSKNE